MNNNNNNSSTRTGAAAAIPTPQRLNGLTPPYSAPQIAAWIAMALTILEYCIVVAPVLHPAAIAPITIVFLGIVGAVLNFAAKAILTDPMDVHVIQELRGRQCLPTSDFSAAAGATTPELTRLEQIYCAFNLERHTQHYVPTDELMKQCWICDMQVADHSMHCKFCNKCVYKFDHHCMWLNTCIGKANYRFFFRTMLSLITLEIYHLVLHIYLIVILFLQGAPARPYPSTITLLVIFFLFLIFNLISIALIGQLILFHMNLLRENLTTYEFIIKDHRERRDQARVLGDLEAKRAQLVDRSSGLASCRLQLGGICRQMGAPSCDPLQPPPPPDPEANGFGTALGPIHNNNKDDYNGQVTSEVEAVPAPLNPAPSSDFFAESTSTEQQRQNSSSLLDSTQEQRPQDDDDTEAIHPSTRGAPPSDIASFSYPSNLQPSEEDPPPPVAAAAAAGGDENDTTTEEPPATTRGDERTHLTAEERSSPPVDDDDNAETMDPVVERFENEPPEMDDLSACSGSRRSTRSTTTGERDYTNF